MNDNKLTTDIIALLKQPQYFQKGTAINVSSPAAINVKLADGSVIAAESLNTIKLGEVVVINNPDEGVYYCYSNLVNEKQQSEPVQIRKNRQTLVVKTIYPIKIGLNYELDGIRGILKGADKNKVDIVSETGNITTISDESLLGFRNIGTNKNDWIAIVKDGTTNIVVVYNKSTGASNLYDLSTPIYFIFLVEDYVTHLGHDILASKSPSELNYTSPTSNSRVFTGDRFLGFSYDFVETGDSYIETYTRTPTTTNFKLTPVPNKVEQFDGEVTAASWTFTDSNATPPVTVPEARLVTWNYVGSGSWTAVETDTTTNQFVHFLYDTIITGTSQTIRTITEASSGSVEWNEYFNGEWYYSEDLGENDFQQWESLQFGGIANHSNTSTGTEVISITKSISLPLPIKTFNYSIVRNESLSHNVSIVFDDVSDPPPVLNLSAGTAGDGIDIVEGSFTYVRRVTDTYGGTGATLTHNVETPVYVTDIDCLYYKEELTATYDIGYDSTEPYLNGGFTYGGLYTEARIGGSGYNDFINAIKRSPVYNISDSFSGVDPSKFLQGKIVELTTTITSSTAHYFRMLPNANFAAVMNKRRAVDSPFYEAQRKYYFITTDSQNNKTTTEIEGDNCFYFRCDGETITEPGSYTFDIDYYDAGVDSNDIFRYNFANQIEYKTRSLEGDDPATTSPSLVSTYNLYKNQITVLNRKPDSTIFTTFWTNIIGHSIHIIVQPTVTNGFNKVTRWSGTITNITYTDTPEFFYTDRVPNTITIEIAEGATATQEQTFCLMENFPNQCIHIFSQQNAFSVIKTFIAQNETYNRNYYTRRMNIVRGNVFIAPSFNNNDGLSKDRKKNYVDTYKWDDGVFTYLSPVNVYTTNRYNSKTTKLISAYQNNAHNNDVDTRPFVSYFPPDEGGSLAEYFPQ